MSRLYVWGSRFWVLGFGFWGLGSGFRVPGSRFQVPGSGLQDPEMYSLYVWGSAFRVYVLGFRLREPVMSTSYVPGSGIRFRLRVPFFREQPEMSSSYGLTATPPLAGFAPGAPGSAPASSPPSFPAFSPTFTSTPFRTYLRFGCGAGCESAGAARLRGVPSSTVLGLPDYSHVDMLVLRYKPVNFGAGKSPGSIVIGKAMAGRQSGVPPHPDPWTLNPTPQPLTPKP